MILSPNVRMPIAPFDLPSLLRWAGEITRVIAELHKVLVLRVEDMVQQGTFAARPNPMGTRRFYWASDTHALYYDDGTWRGPL